MNMETKLYVVVNFFICFPPILLYFSFYFSWLKGTYSCSTLQFTCSWRKLQIVIYIWHLILSHTRRISYSPTPGASCTLPHQAHLVLSHTRGSLYSLTPGASRTLSHQAQLVFSHTRRKVLALYNWLSGKSTYCTCRLQQHISNYTQGFSENEKFVAKH